MSTTQTGVASASAVAATPHNSEPQSDMVDSFQNLWDAQNAIDQQQEPERPDLDNHADEGEEQVEEGEEQQTEEGDQRQRPDKNAKAKPAKKPGEKGEQTEEAEEGEEAQGEEKHYETLDQYLADNKLEPESFMQLPVKVTVDGSEHDVSIAELKKGYQLASASYARMNEAAQERQKISTEVTQVRGALGVQIKQANTLLQLAQNQLVQDFHGIDWNALREKDAGLYSATYTDFQARQTAIQKAMQDVAAAEQNNARAAETQRAQAIPVERQRLLQARPEWSDPAKAQSAHRAMSEVGRKLGFTDAELQSVTDHRQLLVLDMAARFAQLQAKTPATLKRVRVAPKMAKPGTRQVRDPRGSAIKQASDAWARSGYSNDDAAAALLERLG